jgi:hypothetical protein
MFLHHRYLLKMFLVYQKLLLVSCYLFQRFHRHLRLLNHLYQHHRHLLVG